MIRIHCALFTVHFYAEYIFDQKKRHPFNYGLFLNFITIYVSIYVNRGKSEQEYFCQSIIAGKIKMRKFLFDYLRVSVIINLI